MEFYSATFFCEKGKSKGPVVHIDQSDIENTNDPYPISIYINTSPVSYSHPQTAIHLSSESELIRLVNSVKSEYDKYRKEKGYDK